MPTSSKNLLFLFLCAMGIGFVFAPYPPTQHDARTVYALQDTTIERYGKFELAFDIPGSYDNPYDTADVDVGATFTDPSGRTTRVPAFFIQIYEDQCSPENCEVENLQPSGESRWHVRFSPTTIGEWRYLISGTVNGENVRIGQGAFTVTPTDDRGIIRVADNNRYFEFENGDPYFPIGQNLAWSWDGGGGLYTYIDWLDQLAIAGANYARINIDIPWFIGLEWTSPPGQYNDAGQAAAYRLDRIVEAAEARGIYLHITLIWHQSFREYTGLPVNIPAEPARPNTSADFDNHPYNSTQGGNLTGPGDILYNSLAQGWLQRRLRYIMARYSYSTAVFAWEVVDALDRIAQFETARGLDWLERMTATIREYDTNHHLLSVGTRSFLADVQGSELIDFGQVNIYQRRPIEATVDQSNLTFATLANATAILNKPIIINEFSLNPWFEPSSDDPTGIHIRNTLWASILNGAAGSAMPYWWDTYLDPQNLYALYTPIRLFSEGLRWNELSLETIEPSLILAGDTAYEPIIIDDFNPTFGSASPTDTVYEITSDGSTPPTALMSSYLYGQRYNAANAKAEVFLISPPIDTVMTVRVAAVSNSADARLVVTIDGATALAIDLSAGTGATTFSIPLAAGPHEIIFENPGEDWLQLGAIEIEAYRSDLRVFALADEASGTALAWVHHRDYTWDNVQGQREITPIQATLAVPNMPPGEYRVEFWDTYSGNVIGEDFLTLSADDDGNLVIELLPIQEQMAIRILRLSGPEDNPQVASSSPTESTAPAQAGSTPRLTPTMQVTIDANATEIPIN